MCVCVCVCVGVGVGVHACMCVNMHACVIYTYVLPCMHLCVDILSDMWAVGFLYLRHLHHLLPLNVGVQVSGFARKRRFDAK